MMLKARDSFFPKEMESLVIHIFTNYENAQFTPITFDNRGAKTQAQDYQTVYLNRVALFDHNRIKGLRIDSVKVVAADTILYPFASIQEVSSWCYSPYKASWIGEKVIIKSNGENLFFNREGNTITLKTKPG